MRRRGYRGPMTDYGAWQQHVRRPESGTWQSLAMKSAAMEAVQGPMDTLWTWQQQEEAVQGPMAEWRSVSSSLNWKAIQRHYVKNNNMFGA
ncbi:unnamed protein product [Staurois parvus]|uniref:Uncharacterized protein n=1 Tax=Staurois parvus TaxID=386267 RepID=A0ABN9D541_9NEOB|nr:unnamed protein product [Staurois parvus]